MSQENAIVFEYTSGGVLKDDIVPVPAHTAIPDWYRHLEPLMEAKSASRTTVKLCRPFSDAMKQGFILPAATDIRVANGSSGITVLEGEEYVSVSKLEDSKSTYSVGVNSKYPNPDIVVELPWNISVPSEYGVLITKCHNREFSSASGKRQSLFVPDDELPQKVPVPMTVPEGITSIQEGEWLTQVIPLNMASLDVGLDIHSMDENPVADEMSRLLRKRNKANPGLYRFDYWMPKPQTQIERVSQPDPPSKTASETEIADRVFWMSTRDIDYGVIGEPILAESVSQASQTPEVEFESKASVSASDIAQWMVSANELGLIIRLPYDITITTEGGSLELFSRYDKPIGDTMNHKQIGFDFPMSGHSLLNIYSPWVNQAPPGYSSFYCEPFNHHQQFYRAFSGLVDDDRTEAVSKDGDVIEHYAAEMNGPGLFIEREKTITLPRGTPIMQLLPYHRESILTSACITEE